METAASGAQIFPTTPAASIAISTVPSPKLSDPPPPYKESPTVWQESWQIQQLNQSHLTQGVSYYDGSFEYSGHPSYKNEKDVPMPSLYLTDAVFDWSSRDCHWDTNHTMQDGTFFDSRAHEDMLIRCSSYPEDHHHQEPLFMYPVTTTTYANSIFTDQYNIRPSNVAAAAAAATSDVNNSNYVLSHYRQKQENDEFSSCYASNTADAASHAHSPCLCFSLPSSMTSSPIEEGKEYAQIPVFSADNMCLGVFAAN